VVKNTTKNTTCASLSALTRGCTYKKKLHIPGSLSLSPPLEERARGEVRGSWTLIGSNHLTTIFSQCVLYLAGIWIIISRERVVLIEKVFISEFIMAIHDFQNISKSVPGGRPSGTAPIAETGAVPAP